MSTLAHLGVTQRCGQLACEHPQHGATGSSAHQTRYTAFIYALRLGCLLHECVYGTANSGEGPWPVSPQPPLGALAQLSQRYPRVLARCVYTTTQVAVYAYPRAVADRILAAAPKYSTRHAACVRVHLRRRWWGDPRPVQRQQADVARAIARYEQVWMLTDPKVRYGSSTAVYGSGARQSCCMQAQRWLMCAALRHGTKGTATCFCSLRGYTQPASFVKCRLYAFTAVDWNYFYSRRQI